jgi:hypothetical protein
MPMTTKYHEEILRHVALMPDGEPCEILERLTFARELQADGSLSEARQVNQRFDLQTGERVNHLGGNDYELDFTGEKLRTVQS